MSDLVKVFSIELKKGAQATAEGLVREFDQAAYDAHCGSNVYDELIAGKFRELVNGWSEVDHEMIVGV